MSQATITIESSGWTAFLQALSSNYKPTKLLRAAFNTVGFANVIKHFSDEEGPTGSWNPRAQSTNNFYDAVSSGRRKPPKGIPKGAFSSGNKLLQMTGKMRQSLLPSNVTDLSKDSIMFFTNHPYSRAHDEGNTKTNLPARSFMWLSDQAQETMAEVVLDKWTEGA